MSRYSIETRTRKFFKRSVFLSFARNSPDKYRKILLDTPRKSGLGAAKTFSKKLVHRTTEVTGGLKGNKIAEQIVKPKLLPNVNLRNSKEIVILPEKKQKNTKGIKTGTIKRNARKYLNY